MYVHCSTITLSSPTRELPSTLSVTMNGWVEPRQRVPHNTTCKMRSTLNIILLLLLLLLLFFSLPPFTRGENKKNDDDVIVQEKNENTVRMHALTNMHKECFGRAAYVAHGRSTFSSLLLGTQLKRHVKWHAILHHDGQPNHTTWYVVVASMIHMKREKKEKRMMIFISCCAKNKVSKRVVVDENGRNKSV